MCRENEEFYYDCPDGCGGCSCHLNPPCPHCVDHCKEKEEEEE